jgi:hypothetical protein
MVSILKWIGLILLTPLYSLVLLINSVNAFQLLYVIAFRVVNRTSRSIWITPVGTFDSGEKGILRQFIAGFPALPALRERNHWVKPGGSKWIHFDRKGLGYYQILVSNAQGEYRQLGIDPFPSKENLYRRGENHYIIEDWGSLTPVGGDILAAALESGKSWLAWMFFLVGFAVFVFYCWLMELCLGTT